MKAPHDPVSGGRETGAWRRLFWYGLAAVLLFIAVRAMFGGTQDSAAPPAARRPPTRAVAECPSPQQDAYFREVGRHAGTIGNSFGRLGSRFTQAAENDALMVTDEWRLAVVTELAKLKIASSLIRELNPPPGVESIHVLMSRLPHQLDDFTAATASGIDNLDVSQLERAGDMMTAITTTAGDMTAILRSFCT